MNMNWYMPTRIVTGNGCVKKAAAEFRKLGNKCMIITGRKSARACGALADIEETLSQAGVEWVLYDQVSQNPKLTECMDAAQQGIQAGAEFVIGIGGGSPLDAAKCTAVLIANAGMTEPELYSLNWPVKPLPVVAVGTTAGTGSEVTKVSVITNSAGRKKSFHHNDVYPVLSLGDAAYTKSLSDEFTRNTAIDAWAHCVESYFNRNANELTQTYAVRGLQILLAEFRNMLDAQNNVISPLNLSSETRENLYHASLYGGLAINMTGTALPHAMGYLLTEEHQIPHGVACAVFLPAFHAHNKSVVPDLVTRFLKDVGLDEQEYLRIVKQIPCSYAIHITAEDVKRSHDRWIDNGSIAKSLGDITADMADDILRSLIS